MTTGSLFSTLFCVLCLVSCGLWLVALYSLSLALYSFFVSVLSFSCSLFLILILIQTLALTLVSSEFFCLAIVTAVAMSCFVIVLWLFCHCLGVVFVIVFWRYERCCAELRLLSPEDQLQVELVASL
jgi:hypothetical protein